ncbi:pumilio homolog 24-like [Corylus avellana]|uniref:pumilio homolog 24-like n=1 Tax=Corylus avellana TaxID=13451 RepID=UPI00286C2DFC|nr:pumilio homolog 24-like [Corylus avellana]
MAAKNQNHQQQSDKTRKRKQVPGAKTEAPDRSATSKKPKVLAAPKPSYHPAKGSTKPFKSPKMKFDKSETDKEKKPMSKRERRINAKELAEARKKKRKRYYTLEHELASLWEKMRCRNIAKEDRSKFVTEALQKMKGKIPEIVGSHISSRVLQTCVKYCSQAERDAVFEELQPHFLTLACNTYAVHLVKKMLDNASKKQLAGFISSLHGHVASLLRHMVGSVVLQHAYDSANATQKQELLLELYSTELQLFKDLVSMKESRLVDVIPKLGLQKGSVLRHMTKVIQPILEKGIVDHSIIHRVLIEYFSIADQSSATDVIQQLTGPLLVRMIHTKDGSRIAMLCVKHGSAKERKKIIKGMKDHIAKIAHDQYGSMVLVCIFSVVDDTKQITKAIIRELQKILKELVLDKIGRRLLLQLLHPNCSRYLSPDDLSSLNLSIPSLSAKGESEASSEVKSSKVDEFSGEEAKDDTKVTVAEGNTNTSSSDNIQLVEGGKKDPFLRRQELLVNSGLAEGLIDICIESAGELLRSNFGKEVIYEVATGGFDGILRPTLDDKLNSLHKAIATLAANSSEESEEEHVLNNFHSSRTIRKLVLDCPTFARTFWKKALKGKSKLWAQGHSSKVICAFLESSDSKVRELAKEELQPLIDGGIIKLPETKQSANES